MKNAREKMAAAAPEKATIEQKNTEEKEEGEVDKNSPATGCKAKRGRKPAAKDSAMNR